MLSCNVKFHFNIIQGFKLKIKVVILNLFSALIILLYQNMPVYANMPDYPDFYGKNWDKALGFLSENEQWMKKDARENNVDINLVKSIIFPELIRYSAIRDKMEITLLKALYVHKGDDYANFSVGHFQIKPSCAEEILSEIEHFGNRRFQNIFKEVIDSETNIEKREKIVSELENPRREFLYVIAVVKILDEKFGRIIWKSRDEKLRFYATAYNCGFSNSEIFIRNQMEIKSFHTSLIKPLVCNSYADIAARFSQISNIKNLE